jgi:hypothetical protein
MKPRSRVWLRRADQRGIVEKIGDQGRFEMEISIRGPWFALFSVVMFAGCGDIPTSPYTAETVESPLSTCGWGGTAWIKGGYISNDNMADVVSPHQSSVYRYISTGATGSPAFSFTFNQAPLNNNLWGGGNYTWVKDFNGDGLDDIASASGGNVYMKLGSGNGFTTATFSVPNVWGTSGYTFVGRFNNDNFADIATASGSQINLFQSTGTMFTTQTSNVPNWGGSDFTFRGRFNDDTIDDIASISGGNVYMKFGGANGVFTSDTWTTVNAWGGAGFTWAADFNGDGFSDLAGAQGGTIFMKFSTGSEFSPAPLTVANQWGNWANLPCDFTGDAAGDLAGVSAGSNSVYMKIWNKTTNRFDSATWTVDPISPWGNVTTQVGDFTGDGRCDIATFFSNCVVKLYESNGVNGFIPHPS